MLTSEILQARLASLPSEPHSSLTEAYQFVDTRKIVADMRDIGYEMTDLRMPRRIKRPTKTATGAHGLHEVEFRPVGWELEADKGIETMPRVLFFNSYDGFTRASFVSGLIRFACSNGLVIGDNIRQAKFWHTGEGMEEALRERMTQAAAQALESQTVIDAAKKIKVSKPRILHIAGKAKEFRGGETDFDPKCLLETRREEDTALNLWTQWNVIQENVIKGCPAWKEDGTPSRDLMPITNIRRELDINLKLWDHLKSQMS